MSGRYAILGEKCGLERVLQLEPPRLERRCSPAHDTGKQGNSYREQQHVRIHAHFIDTGKHRDRKSPYCLNPCKGEERANERTGERQQESLGQEL